MELIETLALGGFVALAMLTAYFLGFKSGSLSIKIRQMEERLEKDDKGQ